METEIELTPTQKLVRNLLKEGKNLDPEFVKKVLGPVWQAKKMEKAQEKNWRMQGDKC